VAPAPTAVQSIPEGLQPTVGPHPLVQPFPSENIDKNNYLYSA
jgi:hypothetical protein